MSDVTVISNFEELTILASDILSGNIDDVKSKYKINFKELSYRVTIKGDLWDKDVDYRGARYISSIQESVDSLINEIYNEELLTIEDRLVKVTVGEGSNDNTVYLERILRWAWSMANWQKFALLVLGLTLFSGEPRNAVNRHFDAKEKILSSQKEMQASSLENEELKRRHEREMAVLEFAFQEGQKPTRTLVSVVEEDATISFDSQPPLSVKEVKSMLPARTRSQSRIAYVDGDYLLTKEIYVSGEWSLLLEKDGLPLKVTCALSDEEKDILLATISEKKKEGDMPFFIHVQVNVRHSEKNLFEGVIIGLGNSREGADRSLSQLVAK